MTQMNHWQCEVNQRIAEVCRKVRKENGLNQVGLCLKIEDYYADKLISAGFNEWECQQFFDGNCDETLIQKLKKKGITVTYKPIAVSTISAYENGKTAIPAYYIQILKEIFGDFDL